MSEYSEKLKDDRWLEKRHDIITAAGGRCEDCGCRGRLEVHHCVYLPGKEPWQHERGELMCLCRGCHADRQKHEDMVRIYIGRAMRKMKAKNVETLAWWMAGKVIRLQSKQDWSEAFS